MLTLTITKPQQGAISTEDFIIELFRRIDHVMADMPKHSHSTSQIHHRFMLRAASQCRWSASRGGVGTSPSTSKGQICDVLSQIAYMIGVTHAVGFPLEDLSCVENPCSAISWSIHTGRFQAIQRRLVLRQMCLRRSRRIARCRC